MMDFSPFCPYDTDWEYFVLKKDHTALNRKLLGRYVDKFLGLVAEKLFLLARL